MKPQARQPSGTVLINGTSVPWIEWTVTSNTFYSPDTYSVQLPVSALPVGLQRADLVDLADISVEVRASLDGSAGTSLIIGVVDELEDDLCENVIHLSGRDYTAKFIDTKTTEKFQNQTSSAIITTLAGRHGLTANAQATKTKVGKYYEIDHDKLTDDITEWDLITYLAQKEGFSAWVTGKTLNFQPVATVAGSPIVISYTPATSSAPASGDFITAKLHRSLTLAGDVTVKVVSWNHKQKQAFTVTSVKQPAKGSGGAPQNYTFRIPGLTKDQAQQEANNRAEQITRHERLFDFTAPGDITTTAQNQIQLQGTGTAWDQLYWIAEIERSMNVRDGFTMDVRTKNHSPQTTVTA